MQLRISITDIDLSSLIAKGTSSLEVRMLKEPIRITDNKHNPLSTGVR
jgi:hypothetical protein